MHGVYGTHHGAVALLDHEILCAAGRYRKRNNNPDATTLEWATPTPPPHGNFTFDVGAYRGPYEYSRDDHEGDFFPQWEEPKREKPAKKSKETEKESLRHVQSRKALAIAQ